MPELAALVQREWTALLDDDVAEAGVDLSGEACPACGCTAPLEAGACSDCGLQLE